MNAYIRLILFCIGTIALTALSIGSRAQQRSVPVASRVSAYDTNRELVVQGTVLSYTENSTRSPLGAHVTVQTLAGPVDVHLGPASYLRANNFSLLPGDTVRLVGASVSDNRGHVFLARMVQKGNQTITVRSPRGFPLANHASRTLSSAERSHSSIQARPR